VNALSAGALQFRHDARRQHPAHHRRRHDRATRTGGPRAGPHPVPLGAFVAEAMKELSSGADEIAVAGAKRLRAAATIEWLTTVFDCMNG